MKVFQEDAVGKTQKEKIEYYIGKWKYKLGLGNYTVKWRRHNVKKDLEHEYGEDGAFISLDEELKVITIGINTKDNTDIEETVVHELLHALFYMIRYDYAKTFDILSDTCLYNDSKIQDGGRRSNYDYPISENMFVLALKNLVERNSINREHPIVIWLTKILITQDRKIRAYEVELQEKEAKINEPKIFKAERDKVV